MSRHVSAKIILVSHYGSKIGCHPGEVEEFGSGVNEGEAEGDEGVDGASDYGVDENLIKHQFQGYGSLFVTH